MVNSNSLRVHLLVLLYDSFNSGLSHAESARIHGVGVSTSRYAAKWYTSDLGTGVLGKCATEWPVRPFLQIPLFPSFYMFYLEESEHLSNGIGIHVHHSAELLVACTESAAQQFAYLKSLGDSQQPDGCGAESLQADSGGFPAQFRVA